MVFAHKTGDFEEIEHVAGLVISPDRTFVLAVLSRRDTCGPPRRS
jgi:hypothetical protein